MFSLSAAAGFGTGPTASRPSEIATDFAPRPYAMAFAVREAVANARAERQFAGVIDALDATPASEPATVPAVAFTQSAKRPEALDRFDTFVGDAVALGAAPEVPVPTMRPAGPEADGL